jgi:hypothetical protein
MLIFCRCQMPLRKSERLGHDPYSWLVSLGLRPRADHSGAADVVRYPNKSLEIPLETFSKVTPENLLWAMLHQLRGKPP